MYFITGCLGITLSFHRQLTHRSFTTPKWLERVFAYCGVMSVQGDPLEWVSCHRYHHLHCETPLDPHSVYEGFWWSHMGWLLDDSATQTRVCDTSNASGAWCGRPLCVLSMPCVMCKRSAVAGATVQWRGRHQGVTAGSRCSVLLWQHLCTLTATCSSCQQVDCLIAAALPHACLPTDIAKDPFYAHLREHYTWHVVGMFAAIFALGGWGSLLWAGCLRTVWVYHITWFVNSASHVWGSQTYNTGELSALLCPAAPVLHAWLPLVCCVDAFRLAAWALRAWLSRVGCVVAGGAWRPLGGRFNGCACRWD
jgi:fatty-acid desaturase